MVNSNMVFAAQVNINIVIFFVLFRTLIHKEQDLSQTLTQFNHTFLCPRIDRSGDVLFLSCLFITYLPFFNLQIRTCSYGDVEEKSTGRFSFRKATSYL